MKQTKWLLPLAVLALATSCSDKKAEEPEANTDGVKSPLTFASDIKGMARATETAFETGDEISLFAVRTTGDESSVVLEQTGNHFQNLKFIYNGSDFVSTPAVYKADDDKFAYFAVYPYSDNNSSEFIFSAKADQSSAEAYTLSDLCTAATSYTTDSHPTLHFFHRMSNLVVNLEGDNLAGEVSVDFIGVRTAAQCNLNNLTFEAVGEVTTVTCNGYGTNSYRAIIAPDTIEAGADLIRVKVNDREYIYTPDENMIFGSGKQISLTFRLINKELVVVTGDINPWNSADGDIHYVVPTEILEEVEQYMPIYTGVNPPNVEGCYLIDPFVTVYCQDQGNGGYYPGDLVNSEFINLTNQNMQTRTLDYANVSAVHQGHYAIGNGAFISGEGADFTVFFNTEGESSGIYTKTALVISGSKVSDGIKNLRYAFVMVDKGDDPENILMAKDVFRVFEDQDGIAVNAEWPGLPINFGSRTAHSLNELIMNIKY